ncbi:MAG: twin-arginine translocase TatA/TatE family subunit [Chloroflexi bacterium]|nr:twin-arginine translocase TatA/TatE family subunit [Chloroflexota bacterium]
MNIFGIGPLEIVFVLIIGILILGPEGMIEAGRKLGKFMRSIIHSTWWQNIRNGVNEIQHLPQRLMREAELEELNEIRDLTKNSFPKIGGKDLINNSSWSGNLTAEPASIAEKEEKPAEQSPIEK